MTGPADSPIPDARALAAALAWWREAGVDLAFADAPHGWLGEAEAPAAEVPAAPPPRAAPPPPPPPERIGGDPATWPQRFADLAAWWLGEPSLDGGMVSDRVAPEGPAGAPLMVLVEAPGEAAMVAGAERRLLDAILAATGIGPDQCLIAAALPRAMPMPDWDALRAARLGDLVAHLIALAAPGRVIAFGPNLSSLFGHDPANNGQSLRAIHQGEAKVPVLFARALATLATRPLAKARFWQDWLAWTADET